MLTYIDPEHLENEYYKKAKETVVIKLTDYSRQELEHRYASLSTDLKEKTDFIDAIRDLMNVDADDVESLKESIIENVEMSNFSLDGVKTLKKQTADILNNLKKGFVEEEMIVYYMDDRTTGKMLIYLENGNFYEERPFTPEEGQTKIKNIG
jgi:hypothetical protein